MDTPTTPTEVHVVYATTKDGVSSALCAFIRREDADNHVLSCSWSYYNEYNDRVPSAAEVLGVFLSIQTITLN